MLRKILKKCFPRDSYPRCWAIWDAMRNYDSRHRTSDRRLLTFHNQYRDKTCVIVGNGPSLKNTPMELLKDHYSFGMNRIYIGFDELGFTPTFYVCVNVLVRRQWTRNERLSYPIIQLPMAITEDGGTPKFFRNKLLWIGFFSAVGRDILNGLHHFLPALPHLPVSYLDHDIGRYFTSKPWNAIGSLRLPLYPFAIALGFLLPLDLSFSIWFFYLFRKGQQVLGAAMGLRALPQFPYLNQQSSGAWIGLFFVAVWLSRSHLKVVMKCIFRRGRSEDLDEPIRYRTAVIGIVIGMVFLTLFCYQAGMSLLIILPFFVIFFMLSTAITRMRAELGPPTHELVNMNAGNMLVDILGTRRVGANNLTVFPFFWFFSGRGYRSHLMPHQLESFKMAENARVNGRRLVRKMVVMR